MADQLPDSGANYTTGSSHLPATQPTTALVLHRTQMALGLLRDVVQESSAEYWFLQGVKHKESKEYEAAVSCFEHCKSLSENNLVSGVYLGVCYALTGNKIKCIESLYQSKHDINNTFYEEYIALVTTTEWDYVFNILNDKIIDSIFDPYIQYFTFGSLIRYAEAVQSEERNIILKAFSALLLALFQQFITSHFFDHDSNRFYYKYGQRGPETAFDYKFSIAVSLAEEMHGYEICKDFWPREEGIIWDIQLRESFKCVHLFESDVVNNFLNLITRIMIDIKISPKIVETYTALFGSTDAN